MVLRQIGRGTKLTITRGEAPGDTYSAEYYDLLNPDSKTKFIVAAGKLSRDFMKIDRETPLNITFTRGLDLCAFTSRAVEKLYGEMVVFEQATEIIVSNQRECQRDELLIEARIHALSEDQLGARRHQRPRGLPILTDTTYDISSVGMCIVSDADIGADSGPYYLVEFSLSFRDYFLLPAKLVRRSDHPRTSIEKYDYGFQFVFDNMPNEVTRLTKAIFSKKLEIITGA